MSDAPSVPPMETRCSVALFRDDEILLVQSTEDGSTVWKLPGGHVRADEGLAACAKRELREETGLVAHELHCALLLDTHDPTTERYVAEIIVYPDEEITGEPRTHERGRNPQFVPLAELENLPMRPPIAAELKDIRRLHLYVGAPPNPIGLYEREVGE